MPEPTPSSSTNYTRIYTVNGPSTTSSSTLPTWITTKTKHKPSQSKKRQRTQHSLGQLELIQDFAFHQSAIKIKLTPDGQHAVGTGTYKPMMKVWDLNQLTVKFERVTDAENVDFVMLSQDWTKSLHLQADRSLQLHTQGGLHHTIRLPTYGRTLNYYSPTCEALVGATGKEVFRFDLDQGRYLSPIQVGGAASSSSSSKTKWKSADEIDGVNCLDVNKTHGLWSFGLDGASSGHVEFWDPRSRSTLTSLNLPTSSLKPSSPNNPASPFMSVTALESHPSDGLSLAVGTSTGHTLLYDLRSPRPFAVKDQGYAEPIKKVNWLIGSDGRTGKIASSDSKVIKVWEKDDHLDNLFSLQPHAPLLDLCPLPGSGILLAALDSPQMSAYYIPELGPAPRWASFLDGVTEELEDDVTGVQAGAKGAYRDYKFIDRSELETLGLSHLIGTPTLKPYMHGYFLSLKLYSTARLIANPQSYEEHRERVLEDKVAKQQESRIRARKVQPKVNKALAERVRKQEEREEAKEKRRREKKGIVLDDPAELDDDEQDEGRQEDERPGGKKATNILQDPRFKELWENPDFEVDEGSREYELLNPGSVHAAKRQKTAVEEEDEESDRASSDGLSHSDSQSESESDQSEQESQDSDEEGELRPRNFSWVDKEEYVQRQAQTRSKPRLVAGDLDAEGASRSSSRSATFGQRLRQGDEDAARSDLSRGKRRDDGILTARRTKDGGMEMSFVPKAGGGRGEDDLNVDYVPQKKQDATAASDGKKRPTDKRVERFAAGLEKGGYRGAADGQREMSEDERKGRTGRRHPGRSASKNVFRGL